MKARLAFSVIILLVVLLSMGFINKTQPSTSKQVKIAEERVPGSGIYAIWYSNSYDLLSIPGIVGGQIVANWETIEPTKGKYDFSYITTELKKLKELGKISTVQINGNNKPDYLFNEVPWVSEKLHHSITDTKGTLMFWHPNHLDAYKRLIEAYGNYLSQHKGEFLGVRLNFNPFGTEITFLAATSPYREADNWNYPEGVSRGADWTNQVANDYNSSVTNAFLEKIVPQCRVFLRSNTDFSTQPETFNALINGELSIFYTGAESEPRTTSTEPQLKLFYDYCRSGKTTAYAEPFASAWGHHGGETEDRAESPPQWFYWRILSDLHIGVSHLAIYASDLKVITTGIYKEGGITYHNDATSGTKYKEEFGNSLNFGARYAGYQATPTISPGAWVAFRGNTVTRSENGISVENRTLTIFTGDYDFLMKRSPDQSVPVDFIGSKHTRYGSWARKLPSGKKMILTPDSRFLESLTNASINITWYDSSAVSSKLKVLAGNNIHYIESTGSRTWKTTKLNLSTLDFNTIEMEAVGGDVIVHMVEIERESGEITASEQLPETKNEVNVFYSQGQIHINGINPGQNVSIYSSSGTVCKSVQSSGNQLSLPVKSKTFYLVRILDKSFKVITN